MRKTYFTLIAALLLIVLNQTASAQQKDQVLLSINGGAAIPVGDFSSVAKTGFGGMFDVRQFVAKRMALGAQVGYFNLKGIPTIDDSTNSIRYHMVPIMGTISYYFGEPKFLTGFGIGIGFNRYEGTKEYETETYSVSEFKSCISPHAHGLIELTPRISVSLMVSYYAIFGGAIDIGYFGVMGGVAWKL